MKQLIVNADDFGLHSFINEAILEGHQRGIITSTSLLASGDAFDEAIEMAKEMPHLGIGIHTTLVGGLKPLCSPKEVSSLVDGNGIFPLSHFEVLKKVAQGKMNYQEVYNELDAQFNKIMTSEIKVTHVDGHQHLHMVPQILLIVIALMKKYGLNKLRIPEESLSFFNGNYNPIRIAGRTGLSVLARKARKTVKPYYFRSPDYFWGMINGGTLTETALLDIVKKVKAKHGVHEIMTHPGISQDALKELFPWGYQWEAELKALCSEEVKDYLLDHHIELINYGDLP